MSMVQWKCVFGHNQVSQISVVVVWKEHFQKKIGCQTLKSRLFLRPIIAGTSTWNLCPNLNPLPKPETSTQTWNLYLNWSDFIYSKWFYSTLSDANHLSNIPLFKTILSDTNRSYPIQTDFIRHSSIKTDYATYITIISYFSFYSSEAMRFERSENQFRVTSILNDQVAFCY